jgi:hypothetical protein
MKIMKDSYQIENNEVGLIGKSYETHFIIPLA